MIEDQEAGDRLLETGGLVTFEIVEQEIQSEATAEDETVRIELQFTADEDEGETPQVMVEWGAFGFVFFVGVLSFASAEQGADPDGEYLPEDRFNVTDLFDALSLVAGGLKFQAKEIRGRPLHTDLFVRPNGRVTLQTRGRGRQALEWLTTLRT